MTRNKIDYGIDLGTTNSEIAYVDNGNIELFRHEPYKKEILPSCISFTKRKQMLIGDRAYYKTKHPEADVRKNTFIEFKRTMGSDDIYYSSHMNNSYNSEELSAEILKQLKLAVDDDFSSVIITVPAAFEQVQIEATKRAARLAGFEYCEFLQEPIAASLAFFNNENNVEGVWLVFDLGGGTFDSALMKMKDGIINVIDHAGDNHLGGKDMDYIIFDEIIIPHLKENYSIEEQLNDEKRFLDLRDPWKYYAEIAKIELSSKKVSIIEPDEPICKDDSGNDIETSIKIERSELEKLVISVIDRAIRISKELLKKNRLSSDDLMTVLMIGGPTYIPILREKVKNEICERINIKIDPMTVVAQGAALFASTKQIPIEKQKRDYSKIQLTLAYPDTTVENEINFGIKIVESKSYDKVPSKIFAKMIRGEKDWNSGKIELEDGVGIIRLHLAENITNVFNIQLFNEAGKKLECEPSSVSILQGLKLAQPPLPHDIGISATSIEAGLEEEILIPIITKGTSLPTVGDKSFSAKKDIRPGNASDVLKVIVWEGVGGTKPFRNVYMDKIFISGDKLSSFLPKGSEIKVTIRMNESRMAKISVYIPYLDETIMKDIEPDHKHSALDPDELSCQIEPERDRLHNLQNSIQEIGSSHELKFDEIINGLVEIDNLNQKGRGDRDRSREVQKRLNELAVKLDDIEKNMQWPKVEKELSEELEKTSEVIQRFGGDREEQILSQIKVEVERAFKLKNIKQAKVILEKLQDLKYIVLFRQPGYWVSILKNIVDSFDEIQWSDRSKAQSLVDKSSTLLASGQYSEEIEQIVMELWKLMPDDEQEKTKEIRTDIPHYPH